MKAISKIDWRPPRRPLIVCLHGGRDHGECDEHRKHDEYRKHIDPGAVRRLQKLELDRWDTIVAGDVLIDSPAGRGLRGLDVLKGWAAQFGGGLAYRIDLIDEHLALDAQGDGRGFMTFNLHWKHAKEVFGLKPTGREGTSVETMILTIRAGKITKVHVGDNSLDLVLYMWDRGWPHPHNVRPEPLVRGRERSVSGPAETDR